MKYYIAVMKEALVQLSRSTPVNIHLTRYDVIKEYNALENVILFRNSNDAICYAHREYYKNKQAKAVTQEQLTCKRAVPIIYEVDVADEKQLEAEVTVSVPIGLFSKVSHPVKTYQNKHKNFELMNVYVGGLKVHHLTEAKDAESSPGCFSRIKAWVGF